MAMKKITLQQLDELDQDSSEAAITTRDIADILNVTRETAWSWVQRKPGFPAPIGKMRGNVTGRFEAAFSRFMVHKWMTDNNIQPRDPETDEISITKAAQYFSVSSGEIFKLVKTDPNFPKPVREIPGKQFIPSMFFIHSELREYFQNSRHQPDNSDQNERFDNRMAQQFIRRK